MLLRCPECEFEFLARRGGEPLWISTPDAMAQYDRARHRAILGRRAKDFENGLWPNQLQALVDALDAPDEPLVMCRCGRPGETGRYMALLFTTEHLVWAWESPLSGTKHGKLHWRDVRTIQALGTPASPQHRGFRVEGEGDVVAVVNFRGSGVSFTDPPTGSTVDDLLTLVSDLHRRHGGSGDVVPAVVLVAPVTPAPSTPPPALAQAPAALAAPPPQAALAASPPQAALAAPPPPAAGASEAPLPPAMPATPARGVASVPAPQTPPPPPTTAAGWYADPWRAARLRWWDGTQWTGHTAP